MPQRLLGAICLVFLAVLSRGAGAADDVATATEEWRLEKDADGIVEGSRHRAVKARMVVATPAAELAAIIRDTATCSEWAQFCAASHVHESLSPEEAYIYTLNDLPWPVGDRDALSHVTWSVDDAGTVRMDAVATDGILEPRRGRVRLTDARSNWILAPTAEGQTEVVSEAHVDPAGPVPAWITNMLLVDAPFQTMARLRALGASGRYAGAQLDFGGPGTR
jgi:hypothetical protein